MGRSGRGRHAGRGDGSLELSEDEVGRFQEQLSAILEAVGKVSELDLEGVSPTSHPLDLVVGQRKARELRDVQHLVSSDLHDSPSSQKEGPPSGGP